MLDSTHAVLGIRQRLARRFGAGDQRLRVDTPTECVAAALKVGRCPDMRGAPLVRNIACNEKNAGKRS